MNNLFSLEDTVKPVNRVGNGEKLAESIRTTVKMIEKMTETDKTFRVVYGDTDAIIITFDNSVSKEKRDKIIETIKQEAKRKE